MENAPAVAPAVEADIIHGSATWLAGRSGRRS